MLNPAMHKERTQHYRRPSYTATHVCMYYNDRHCSEGSTARGYMQYVTSSSYMDLDLCWDVLIVCSVVHSVLQKWRGRCVTHHKSRLWPGTVGHLTATRRYIREGTSARALRGIRSRHGGAHWASPHGLLFIACCMCLLRPTAGWTASHCRVWTHSSSATRSGRHQACAACGGSGAIMVVRGVR